MAPTTTKIISDCLYPLLVLYSTIWSIIIFDRDESWVDLDMCFKYQQVSCFELVKFIIKIMVFKTDILNSMKSTSI